MCVRVCLPVARIVGSVGCQHTLRTSRVCTRWRVEEVAPISEGEKLKSYVYPDGMVSRETFTLEDF